jgi:hypothetical protein
LWLRMLSSFLFHSVSISPDALKNIVPMSPGYLTAIVVGFNIGLMAIISLVPVLHLPKKLVALVNWTTYVVYDVGLMTLLSFLLGRFRCDTTSNSIKLMVGFDNIVCDSTSSPYITRRIMILFVATTIAFYSIYFGGMVRNKSTLPRVW